MASACASRSSRSAAKSRRGARDAGSSVSSTSRVAVVEVGAALHLVRHAVERVDRVEPAGRVLDRLGPPLLHAERVAARHGALELLGALRGFIPVLEDLGLGRLGPDDEHLETLPVPRREPVRHLDRLRVADLGRLRRPPLGGPGRVLFLVGLAHQRLEPRLEFGDPRPGLDEFLAHGVDDAVDVVFRDAVLLRLPCGRAHRRPSA